MGMRIIFYYLIVFLVVPILLGITLQLLGIPLPQVEQGEQPDVAILLLAQALMLPPVCFVTVLWLRRVDHKSPSAVGLGRPGGGDSTLASRQLIGGVLGAGMLLTGWWILVSLLAEIRVEPAESSTLTLLGIAVGFLAAACLEEWVFRGYIYSTLREQLPWVHAAGMTSVLFTMLHLSNPGVGAAGLFNTFVLGLLLAAVREATGSIWPAVAFHAAWNSLIGVVLSLPVSGLVTPRLFQVTTGGGEHWTGGDYGPEGSWLLVGLLFAALGIMANTLPEPNSDDAEDGES